MTQEMWSEGSCWLCFATWGVILGLGLSFAGLYPPYSSSPVKGGACVSSKLWYCNLEAQAEPSTCTPCMPLLHHSPRRGQVSWWRFHSLRCVKARTYSSGLIWLAGYNHANCSGQINDRDWWSAIEGSSCASRTILCTVHIVLDGLWFWLRHHILYLNFAVFSCGVLPLSYGTIAGWEQAVSDWFRGC